MRVKNGFTLTELLLVVALLAILAALVLPRFTGSVEQGRASEAMGILNTIRQGEEAFKNEYGSYLSIPTGNWSDLGLDDPNSSFNRFFGYTVTASASSGGTILDRFFAMATRNNNPTDNAFGPSPGGSTGTARTVALNQSGIWSGTHPLRPQNANNGVCGETDFPGPCAPTS